MTVREAIKLLEGKDQDAVLVGWAGSFEPVTELNEFTLYKIKQLPECWFEEEYLSSGLKPIKTMKAVAFR